jgi:MoxR-like ATPase
MLGASMRGGIALLQASKAVARLRGRDYLVPDDVKELAFPALRHRLILKPEAEVEGLSADDVLARVLARVEVPR